MKKKKVEEQKRVPNIFENCFMCKFFSLGDIDSRGLCQKTKKIVSSLEICEDFVDSED